MEVGQHGTAYPQHTGHAKMKDGHLSGPLKFNIKDLAYSEYFKRAVTLHTDGVFTIPARCLDKAAFYLVALGSV